MSAVLTRIFGFGKIDLVEDAIQESMMRALGNWRINGVPDNPTAWLISAARNHIVDRLRKEGRSVTLDDETRRLEQISESVSTGDEAYFEKELREGQLQMIFACCHPSLTPDSRIALTLKTVGGFGVREIASAFLSKEEAVAKMLTRAKNRLAEDRSAFAIPEPRDIPDRMDAVLKILYLMFNEGYSATEGESVIREDLCHEAIRLVRLLAEHPVTALPRTHALAALLLFQGSRLPARTGDGGMIVLLRDQDRTLWDRRMIDEALRHLQRSASGDKLSIYHLEAEGASYHALASDYPSTDWKSLLSVYDRILERNRSPVAALNRVVAVAEAKGAERAIEELELLRDEKLEAYYPFHIVRADLLKRMGDRENALRAYEFASGLVENRAVRAFVEEQVRKLRPERSDQ